MQKFSLVLGILLVVQIVVSAVLLWPRTSASAVGEPFLAGYSEDAVVSLTVSDGGDGRIALVKGDEGWTLPEAGDFPAQEDRIRPVLEKLAALKTNRLVTETEGSHGRLQVSDEEFNRMLDVDMQDGSHHKLYVGSSGGAGATHIRREGSPDVYLTAGLNPWEINTQASSWVDTLFFTVPQTATVALKIENTNGLFEFDRDGDDWIMTGLTDEESLNDGALSALLDQATSIRMTVPLGKEEKPEYGTSAPQATLTVTTETDGQTERHTVQVGAKDENGDYVVHVSESPYYVQVTGYVGDSFVEKTRDHFIMPPPAPESELSTGIDSLSGLMTE